MKRKAFALMTAGILAASMLTACGEKKESPKETEVLTEAESTVEAEIPTEAELSLDEEPVEIAEDGDSLDFLYEQYYDIITGLDPKWDLFQFADFDGDGFPEVFVSSTTLDMNDLREYLIITHSNAGAEVNENLSDGVASGGGYRGTLYYIPGASTLYERSASAPLNNPCDNVYLLDNGHLTLYAAGRTEVTEDYTGPDDYEHMIWFWNDEEVTAEEYEARLNAETANLSGIELASIDYMDKDSIMSQISDLMG